jgi:hypothetical protein
MEMARKLAPGRQSGHINSGGSVRYQGARIGNPPSGSRVPGWAAGPGRPRVGCLAGTVAITGWGAVDA